jgi:hexosaminidase
VILSPAKRVYLDMKYDSATVLGLRWAGIVPLRTTYDWEPAGFVPGVPERAILGVEAPVWSESLVTRADFEFMLFPACWRWPSSGGRRRPCAGGRTSGPGSPAGPRLQALGVNFYRDPGVPWTMR